MRLSFLQSITNSRQTRRMASPLFFRNVPGVMLPAVIALEIGGGLALILVFQARIAALGLAAFSIVSAVIFHANFSDQAQAILFTKNFAMASGLLYVAALGAGALSIDARLASR